MKKIYLALLILVTLSIIIRLLDLEKSPPHLSNDEISIAYDAYSIAYSGKDEHNHPWPLSFESHGTYKAPLYSYLLAPLSHLLVNSPTTAKLPSIISGFFTIIIIGLITKEITNDKRTAFLASIVLAVAPWHIYTSRMVLEANLALFFFNLGIWLFLISIKQSKISLWHLLLASISLVLSMYGYHTEWLLVPVLVVILSAIYLFKNIKFAFLFILISACLALPIAFDYLANLKTFARANSEVIWKEAGMVTALSQQTFLPNKVALVSKSFLSNYLDYTNPSYLFFYGLRLFPEKNHPYQSSLLLWPLFIPFLVGLFSIRNLKNLKHRKFLILWLLLSPVVPALTHGGTNLIRNLVSIVPYSIITAIGLNEIWRRHRKSTCLIVYLMILNLIFFKYIYLNNFPRETAESYQGYKPVVEYLKTIDRGYTTIIIDYRFGKDNQYVGVPHLYFAYYSKLDPKILQNRTYQPDGMYFDKYKITQIDWGKEKVSPSSLYIVATANSPPVDTRKKLKFIKEITDAAGISAFEIWAGN